MFEFEPGYKFIYRSLNIRSIDDNSYPEISYSESGCMNWMELELWNFYERGLEFVIQTSKQVVIEGGKTWRFANDDEKKSLNCCLYLRLPYENIVEFEAEVNEYNGYPTIYVEYSNNNSPFESEIYGLIGFYNRSEIRKSRKPFYLSDNPGTIAFDRNNPIGFG